MAAISQARPTTNQTTPVTPFAIPVVLWHVFLAGASLYAAVNIWQLPDFYTLGSIVQQFLGLVVGAYGLLALVTAFILARVWFMGATEADLTLRLGKNEIEMRGNGRLCAMGINYIGMVLAGLYLAHLLGVDSGIDYLAEGLFRNVTLLLGLPLGYLLVWIGWRLHESSPTRALLERVGLGIMGISLMLVLLASLARPEADNVVGGLVSHSVMFIQGWLTPPALITTGVVAVFGAVAIHMTRQSAAFNEKTSQRETWQGWLFLLPNLISFLLFFAGPLLLSFYLSFTNYNAISPAEFIGLENYADMFQLSVQQVPAGQTAASVLPALQTQLSEFTIGAQRYVIGARDPLFWISLGNTIRYCLLLLPMSIIPALALALLLNSKIPGMKFYRALFFIPSVAAVVGVALIWKWLYDPVIGYINYAISSITRFFGLADPQILWLTDTNVLLLAVVIMAAWQAVGFNTVIFLAGLQGISRELYEAATVDGAGGWQRFISITLPMLAPTSFFILVTTLIAGLQAFNEFYALVQENPTNAKLTSVYYLQQMGFERFQMGYASATAWVLFALIFVVTLVQFRLSNRASAYAD
ncbi:MAG: sugar ABC transporter permease [Chloroflexi bacterium]|nr:sugar ABC transporter permease [Chloroflexota bacterium]